MKVYYENSNKTKRIDFDKNGYEISDIDTFRHEFQYKTEDDKIQEFFTGVKTYKLEANIVERANESWKTLYEEMIEVFDRDVMIKSPGMLYVNGSYMQCFIYASTPAEIFEDWGFQNTELKIVTDKSFWIQEETFQFLPPAPETQEQSETIKTYDYTYDACVYPTERETPYLINDHYDSCDFKMLIYGPRSQTHITIGENVYHVNYAIQEGEYMVIDSRETAKPGERVYLVRKNGETLNLFDYRDPIHSIFAKIPPGALPISYGDAGVDITIYKRRSEPKWS